LKPGSQQIKNTNNKRCDDVICDHSLLTSLVSGMNKKAAQIIIAFVSILQAIGTDPVNSSIKVVLVFVDTIPTELKYKPQTKREIQ
jgi:hypothetical protein